jgi:hypothetical protein
MACQSRRYRGAIRMAPSRRMTSPLSIAFSTMWTASWIDVVVANAGIVGPVATFAATSADDFERVIDVNVFGVARPQPPFPRRQSRPTGVHGCDSFLHRNQIPYERLNPDDPAAVAHTGGRAPLAGPYPVVVLRDGTPLRVRVS